MLPDPDSRCTFIKLDGRQCKRPGRRGSDPPLCVAHEAPSEAQQRSRANLNVPSNQHLKKPFSLTPEEIAARAEEISPQVLHRDIDGNVIKSLTRTVMRAARYELHADWFLAKQALSTRDERLQEQVEKRLDTLYERLGMTAEARIKYEPIQRAQEIAKLRGTKPSTDRVHQKMVLGQLLHRGAMNKASLTWARQQDPDGDGSLILLSLQELAALNTHKEVADATQTPAPPRAVSQPNRTRARNPARVRK